MSFNQEPVAGDPAGAPSLAVGAYSEALVRGRRVLVLGDATSPLAEQLAARGARLVHVYDTHPGRVSVGMAKRAAGDGRSNIVIAQLGDDVGVRDGAFDVVVIPDLPLLGSDINDLIRRARRLVSPLGVVVIASPNPEAERFLALPPANREGAPSYYDLFDAVSLQFADVRMLGQAPFVGYAIVDFAEADPAVSVDTSLLVEPEAPEWYIAIASDRPQTLDPYSLVAVPLETIAAAMPDEHATIQPPPMQLQPDLPSDDEVQLAEARARITVLTTENERLREAQAALARSERLASDATARASSFELRVTELEAERAAAVLKAQSFERRTEELERALNDAAQSRSSALADAARIREVAVADATLAREAALADARAAREAAARDVGDRDHKIAELTARVDTLRVEIERKSEALQKNETLAIAALQKRNAELEAQILALDPPTLRSKEMREQRILALEGQRNELLAREKELLAKEKDLRATERELRASLAEITTQVSELSRRHQQAEQQRVEAEERRNTAEAEREAAERALAERPAENLSELEAALSEERSNVANLEDERRKLEAALQRRGHDLQLVQRENDELARVGKELLREFLAASSGHPQPVGGGSSGGGIGSSNQSPSTTSRDETDELKRRLDAAVNEAARREADRVAANWKVAQLTRELRERPATSDSSDVRTRELERALFRAQQELALVKSGAAKANEPARDLVEDAVLLEQVGHPRELLAP